MITSSYLSTIHFGSYHQAKEWYQFCNNTASLWEIHKIMPEIFSHCEYDNQFMASTIHFGSYHHAKGWYQICNNPASLWEIHEITSKMFSGPSTVLQCDTLWVSLNMITSSITAAWLAIDCEYPRIWQFVDN